MFHAETLAAGRTPPGITFFWFSSPSAEFQMITGTIFATSYF
jgi:hypothetical protein